MDAAITVGSFNVRVPCDPEPNDWASRKDRVNEIIRANDIQIFGVQEAVSHIVLYVNLHFRAYRCQLIGLVERGDGEYQIHQNGDVQYDDGCFLPVDSHLLYLRFSFQNLCYLWHIVVEVAGSEYDEHVEVAAFHEVKHIVLADHLLLHARCEVVVDNL